MPAPHNVRTPTVPVSDVCDSDACERDAYSSARQAQVTAIQARLRKAQKAARTGPCSFSTVSAAGAHALQAVSPTQRRGRRAEEQAADYVQKRGLHVLQRNLHCRMGEIDLVATDQRTLIFIEVRLRAHRRYGGAAASVNRRKQIRLIRAARYFLSPLTVRYFRGKTPACRFDVITIDGNSIHWITHAFTA